MTDPWAEADAITAPREQRAWRAGYNAALAAVRPEYDRVCAERDAWEADAHRGAAGWKQAVAERDAALDRAERAESTARFWEQIAHGRLPDEAER